MQRSYQSPIVTTSSWEGREAGLERLSDYVWRTDFQSLRSTCRCEPFAADEMPRYTYHTDRLEHFGEYYASRLGPWMAHGCLSPRKVSTRSRVSLSS